MPPRSRFQPNVGTERRADASQANIAAAASSERISVKSEDSSKKFSRNTTRTRRSNVIMDDSSSVTGIFSHGVGSLLSSRNVSSNATGTTRIKKEIHPRQIRQTLDSSSIVEPESITEHCGSIEAAADRRPISLETPSSVPRDPVTQRDSSLILIQIPAIMAELVATGNCKYRIHRSGRISVVDSHGKALFQSTPSSTDQCTDRSLGVRRILAINAAHREAFDFGIATQHVILSPSSIDTLSSFHC